MEKDKLWWKNEIFYQIYPRSFQDSNGDGIGDLQGIISRLDYIKDLGITAIWLSPIYKSPMVDMGYDISDYQAIDPIFGTMADFDELMEEAQKRDIKIIMDLVVNHTSDQHPWFKEAISNPESPYRDFYYFKKTKDGKKPNNWRSIFGGSTWEPVPNEPGNFYFNSFSKYQPDLNWENPKLRKVIYKMINWWLEKGVAGFRVDAINFLKKDQDWKSLPADANDGLVSVIHKGQNRPGLEVFLDELKHETFEKYNAVTVGEAYGLTPAETKKMVGKNGSFSMVFDFGYMNIEVEDIDEWFRGQRDWTIPELRKLLFETQMELQGTDGWLATVLENHDQPRVLSKLIKNKSDQTATAAKALATMYFFLPGDPFVYQGQELGMKNTQFDNISKFKDINTMKNYQIMLDNGCSKEQALKMINFESRDNARTPMQWNGSEKAGFTTGNPWIELGNDRVGINVADEQTDPESTLNFYRQMISVRKEHQNILINGNLSEINDVPENIIAYKRELDDHELLVWVNLCDKVSKLPEKVEGKVLLNNYDDYSSREYRELDPYQAIVIYQ
ncbi:alpha-glucosidase [Fructilactobacillus vespulae]|uniref:glycoside hydrolase family 13 protein n=1 Tax=Fructilactobacillus vespulae TaxID=1249630 RepID=UPI0039B5B3F8